MVFFLTDVMTLSVRVCLGQMPCQIKIRFPGVFLLSAGETLLLYLVILRYVNKIKSEQPDTYYAFLQSTCHDIYRGMRSKVSPEGKYLSSTQIKPFIYLLLSKTIFIPVHPVPALFYCCWPFCTKDHKGH